MTTVKTQPKKQIPPPGRKLSRPEARKAVHNQFGPALAKLAK